MHDSAILAFGLVVTLTCDLWPWELFSNVHTHDKYLCQVIEIPPQNKEIASPKISSALTDKPHGWPDGRTAYLNTYCLLCRFFSVEQKMGTARTRLNGRQQRRWKNSEVCQNYATRGGIFTYNVFGGTLSLTQSINQFITLKYMLELPVTSLSCASFSLHDICHHLSGNFHCSGIARVLEAGMFDSWWAVLRICCRCHFDDLLMSPCRCRWWRSHR